MLFFRSEERVREWCSARGAPLRPRVGIDQLWRISTTWYSTRLEEHSHRPKPEEIRGIFAAIGLDDDFWDPLSGRYR